MLLRGVELSRPIPRRQGRPGEKFGDCRRCGEVRVVPFCAVEARRDTRLFSERKVRSFSRAEAV
jgi:hypothetical protein